MLFKKMSRKLRKYSITDFLIINCIIIIILFGWYLTIRDIHKLEYVQRLEEFKLSPNHVSNEPRLKPDYFKHKEKLQTSFLAIFNETLSAIENYTTSGKQLEKNESSESFYDETFYSIEMTLEQNTTDSAIEKEENMMKSLRLVLDTPGCKIPEFDPWDTNVVDLFEPKYEDFDCGGKKVFLEAHANGSITINETILDLYYNTTIDDISCAYIVVNRVPQEETHLPRENDFKLSVPYVFKAGKIISDEYVGVICNVYNDTENLFEHYFALVHPKNGSQLNKKEKRHIHDPPLNIILIGIDSISKLNFLRHFNRTHKFIKENMSAFDLKGYTKVGDNTFPNLMALLTGQRVETYFNESLENEMYFDHLDFIWKDYARQGYKTFYAEDYPSAGTFNFNKRGFRYPPTDYYYRPLGLAIDFAKSRFQKTGLCLNSETDTDIIYNYKKIFLEAMKDTPLFAFSMVSTMTHDFLNSAGYQDFPTVRLLQNLYDSGMLNKSMLVIFSDHGIRYGDIRERYIGKFEERMPFMYINFPVWFLEQHPSEAHNLKINEDRLVTLFDVHATMVHLLHVNEAEPLAESASLGTSLMSEIPSKRTCSEANIAPHFCPCQTFHEVSVQEKTVQDSALAMVDFINLELSEHSSVCAHLAVDKVTDARMGQVNSGFLKFRYWDAIQDILKKPGLHKGKITPMMDYLITLITKPGGGIFEGTVRHTAINNTVDILGISRINMYGNQSHCITSPKLKLYCYCIH